MPQYCKRSNVPSPLMLCDMLLLLCRVCSRAAVSPAECMVRAEEECASCIGDDWDKVIEMFDMCWGSHTSACFQLFIIQLQCQCY